MSLTRRSLIKRGALGGAAAAAVGGGWLAFKPSRLVPLPAEPLQVLDAKTYSVLHAITGRVLTEPAASPVVKALVPQLIDQHLSGLPAGEAGDYVQAIRAIESPLRGFVLDLRATPFSQLDAEGQDDVLDAWRGSTWSARRGAYQRVKQLITAVYYGHPSTYAVIGYPGPPRHLLP